MCIRLISGCGKRENGQRTWLEVNRSIAARLNAVEAMIYHLELISKNVGMDRIQYHVLREADINASNNSKQTAIHIAAYPGNITDLSTLIKAKADIDLIYVDGLALQLTPGQAGLSRK